MFILLNRDTMRVTHKHEDYSILANLSWIENQQTDSYIFRIDDAMGLKSFTDMELRMLYENVTGAVTTLDRLPLLQVLTDLLHDVSESDVDIDELEQQANFVQEDDERSWLYVRGARKPALKNDLFQHACLRAKANPKKEQAAIDGNRPALSPTTVQAAAPTGRAKAAAPTSIAKKRTFGPRASTVKPIIWNTADRMWEESGKPTEKAEVLKLRKAIMDTLEHEEHIKRATASSELGNWHRDRAPY